MKYVSIKEKSNGKLIGYIAQDEQGTHFLKPVDNRILKGISGTQYVYRSANTNKEGIINEIADYVDPYEPNWINALSETLEEPYYIISQIETIENLDDLPLGE